VTASTTASERRTALFWLGILAAFLVLLYLLNGILLPFVAGAAIAYFLNPAVDRLELWRLPRAVATGVVLLLFVAVLVLLMMLLLPLLQVQAAELARRAPAVVEFGRREIQHFTELAQQQLAPEDLARVREMAGSWAGAALGWAAAFLEGLLTRGVAIASVLSLIFITPIVAFFLLRDWERLVAHIDGWLPRRHAAVIREQARLVDHTLAGFVHGQMLVGLILAVYYGAALTLAGLQFAIIIGILIGVLCFIPYVGVAIGLVLALGLALVQFGSWTMLGVVLAIFAVGHATESNLLSPKLVGERVNLHPVWIIFALLAFGTLFGFVGLLLALPAAAVIGVLVRFALGRYLTSRLYDPDSHPPHAPL
jgi:predicted PurR-regulated permease PerM